MRKCSGYQPVSKRQFRQKVDVVPFCSQPSKWTSVKAFFFVTCGYQNPLMRDNCGAVYGRHKHKFHGGREVFHVGRNVWDIGRGGCSALLAIDKHTDRQTNSQTDRRTSSLRKATLQRGIIRTVTDLAVSSSATLQMRPEVITVTQEVVVADETLERVSDDVDVYRTC